MKSIIRNTTDHAKQSKLITLFLAGDVMTGRGIDQILHHPGDPVLFEGYIKDARAYVELAERAYGPVPRASESRYIWGDALPELEKMSPDARIINLETCITRSGDFWQWKEVHYRMNPENRDCLTVAGIDVCSLANNHILDWGYAGLKETVETLKKANIRTAGAGANLHEAAAPAIIEIKGKGRVVVFAYGSPTSGIRLNWGAAANRPGVNLVTDYSAETVRRIRERIRGIKNTNDIIVFSIHWGPNWGHEIQEEEIEFAHRLIESGVDIIHGHSSHHVKGVEIYQQKPIFYGSGDFLNDYEGIPGYEDYHPGLGIMYFPTMDPAAGELAGLAMIPTRIRHLRVNRVKKDEALLLASLLNRVSKKFGTKVELTEDGILILTSPLFSQRLDSVRLEP